MAKKKYRVFVSYARKDAEKAEEVTAFLQKNRITYWFDRDSMESTENFRTKIEKSIQNADAFLFLMSENSQNSKNCQDEVIFAENFQKRIFIWHIDSSEPNAFIKMHMGMINRDEFYCYDANAAPDIQKQKNFRDNAVRSIRNYLKEIDRKIWKKGFIAIILTLAVLLLLFFALVWYVDLPEESESSETGNSVTVSSSGSKGYFWTDLAFWDDDGAFVIDKALFGMRYEDLGNVFNMEFEEPRAYDLEENYTYTAQVMDNDSRRIAFIFNPDGYLTQVAGDTYSDVADNDTISALNRTYGKCTMYGGSIYSWEPGGNWILQMFQLYDDDDVIRQQYTTYHSYSADNDITLETSDDMIWQDSNGMLRIDESIFEMSVEEFVTLSGWTVSEETETGIKFSNNTVLTKDENGIINSFGILLPGTVPDSVRSTAYRLYSDSGYYSEGTADIGKYSSWDYVKGDVTYSYMIIDASTEDEQATMQAYTKMP